MHKNRKVLNNNRILHGNNKGSTMVEVIVGFVILVMVIAECMVHLVGVSSELVKKSKDMQEDQRVLNAEMYNKETTFQSLDGVSLTLTLDTEKTKTENLAASSGAVSLPLNAELKRYHSDKADLTVFRIIQKEP